MEVEHREELLKDLIKHNYPFVLFREPGGDIKFLIQKKPVDFNAELKIDERGFYVFPFSKKEKSLPFFLSPDFLNNWKDDFQIDFKLELLTIPPIQNQHIYTVEYEEYEKDIAHFLQTIHNGPLKKAIYARVKLEHFPSDFKVSDFYHSIEQKYRKAFCYLMNVPGDGLWVGASPELLLSYKNQIAKTVALAGTIKNDRQFSAPNWSRKEIDEHRLVELHIIKLLKSSGISYEKSKVRTSNTGTVFHLKSNFKMGISPDKISDFLTDLHPTPAISGLPQAESLDIIYEKEKFDRSYYCGYLGFVDGLEDFKVYINLRCLKIWENKIAFFAGGGITGESEAKKEWEETELKMSTLSKLLKSDLSPSVN